MSELPTAREWHPERLPSPETLPAGIGHAY